MLIIIYNLLFTLIIQQRNINSPDEENISKLFVYEKSNNNEVKKMINSFIVLNGYEAWYHKCNY